MTSSKKFKRRVRARMEETEESYTTARSNILANDPAWIERTLQEAYNEAAKRLIEPPSQPLSRADMMPIMMRLTKGHIDPALVKSFIEQRLNG